MTCALYYKHMTIVNDDSSIVSEQSFQLVDDARGVIYDHRMFIIQATEFPLFEDSAIFVASNLTKLCIKMIYLNDFQVWLYPTMHVCDSPKGGPDTGVIRLAPFSQTVGSLIRTPTSKRSLLVKKNSA